jgi:glycyl-tRNA synthetase alpha subunit
VYHNDWGGSFTLWVYYTIAIDVKNGKYRYTISNFENDQLGAINNGVCSVCEGLNGMAMGYWKKRCNIVVEEIPVRIPPIITSLKAAMQKANAEKSDW